MQERSISMSKATWGRSELKFCPKNRKVWQLKYDSNIEGDKLVVYDDMPSYGLKREDIPEKYEYK